MRASFGEQNRHYQQESQDENIQYYDPNQASGAPPKATTQDNTQGDAAMQDQPTQENNQDAAMCARGSNKRHLSHGDRCPALMVASASTSSAATAPHLPTTSTSDNNQPQLPATPPLLSINHTHQALNTVWREYFTRHQPRQDLTPEIQQAKVLPDTNVPWGPDAHEYLEEDTFRIYSQNMHGFSKVNNTLPSWASTMDFLHGLRVSMFCFSEPNQRNYECASSPTDSW
jgi:hypothetical protein